MPVEFKLPSLGEGVESADVAEILVSEGDTVEKDQPILELETEKAVMEVPCSHAGTITRIHVSEGDTIQVGQLLVTIETDGAEAGEGSGEQTGGTEEAAESPTSSEPADASATAVAEQAPGATESQAGQGGGTDEVVTFRLPNLGEGIESADVAEVLVSVGDEVEAEQPVLELETEKAVMEVPSPQAGTIESVSVAAGDTISVGQEVLTIRVRSGAGKPASAPAEKAAPAAKAVEQDRGTTEQTRSESRSQLQVSPASTKTLEQPGIAPGRPSSTTNGDSGPPIPAAPSTRRLARQLGVNLREVRGSGRGSRITREDVQDYVRQRMTSGTLMKPASAAAGTALAAGSLAPPPLPDFSRFGPIEREKLSKIARTSAENLTVSWNVIPHVTQHDRADITDLEQARKRFSQGVGKNGPKVTMTAVAIKALATCLQAFPKFNSSLDPETNELVYKKYYHIGCAVDTPHGLLVPVVRDCDRKSILDIAADLTDLALKAREKKLPLDAMQGATCTVTNLGGIGGTAFTPIVNYPEVCILGMARSQNELKLVDGEVVERMFLPVALSYDHRVINGADAARFLSAFCNMLADPFQLLSAI